MEVRGGERRRRGRRSVTPRCINLIHTASAGVHSVRMPELCAVRRPRRRSLPLPSAPHPQLTAASSPKWPLQRPKQLFFSFVGSFTAAAAVAEAAAAAAAAVSAADSLTHRLDPGWAQSADSRPPIGCCPTAAARLLTLAPPSCQTSSGSRVCVRAAAPAAPPLFSASCCLL